MIYTQIGYSCAIIFIKAPLFTKYLPNYLSDDSYSDIQGFLIEKPDAGDLIQGTGGLRKLRWGMGNKGKRGGLRIIYYWQISDEHIYLLTIYGKNEMNDLSEKEKKALRQW